MLMMLMLMLLMKMMQLMRKALQGDSDEQKKLTWVQLGLEH